MTRDVDSYAEGLRRLASELPRLAERLADAEEMRTSRLALMAKGVRFLGLEELLRVLDKIADEWGRDSNLGQIAFLVRRSIGDFETADEAALSGYPSVAHEAMRDVMEAELLLLDFYVEPPRVDRWLRAGRRERFREFRPVVVRERLVSLGLHEVVDAPNVESDYRGQSESLHVAPPPGLPFLDKGLVKQDDVVTREAAFIEIFEHGRRLGNALRLVAHALSPDSPAEEACEAPLPAFSLAHERTQEIFGQFMEALRSANRVDP